MTDSRLGGRPRTRLVAEVRARRLPCPLCSYPIDQSLPRTGRRHPLSSVVDEWFPRTLGGPVDATNCVETHSLCNGIKGSTWPVTPDLKAKCRRRVEAILNASAPTLRPI
jgi:hypothetical protein